MIALMGFCLLPAVRFILLITFERYGGRNNTFFRSWQNRRFREFRKLLLAGGKTTLLERGANGSRKHICRLSSLAYQHILGGTHTHFRSDIKQ